jgi:hypothetical protein
MILTDFTPDGVGAIQADQKCLDTKLPNACMPWDGYDKIKPLRAFVDNRTVDNRSMDLLHSHS